MTQNLTTLERLRLAGCSDDEADAIGEAIEEDNIDLINNCDGNCWLCHRLIAVRIEPPPLGLIVRG